MSKIEHFCIGNKNHIFLEGINLGAAITKLWVLDKFGKSRNIVVGFDTSDHYKNNPNYHGVVVGRFANRIRNARFDLDGVEIKLQANQSDKHSLHGGYDGFHCKIWNLKYLTQDSVTLQYFSKHGEAGFPGNIDVEITYKIIENKIEIIFKATSDRRTPLNLTQHSYFNLNGEGTIETHELRVPSDEFIETDHELVPTGRIISLPDNIDFNCSKSLKNICSHGGLDHYFILNNQNEKVDLFSVESGIRMKLKTNYPGLQIYSGQGLAIPFNGICLEAHDFPDSLHHPHFSQSVVEPLQNFERRIVLEFSQI
jgi:aldose 1-epimerase